MKKTVIIFFGIIIFLLFLMMSSGISFTAFVYFDGKATNKPFLNNGADKMRLIFGVDFVEDLEVFMYKLQDNYHRMFNPVDNVIIDSNVWDRIDKKAHMFSEKLTTISKNEKKDYPENIKPLIIKPEYPEEGIWKSEGLPEGKNGKKIFYKTEIRPDPKRPWSIVTLCYIDLSEINLYLVAGSDYRGLNGKKGAGHIQSEYFDSLLCAFNGGFLPVHNGGGMIINHEEFLRMRNNLGTFIVYDDGSVDIVTWKRQKKQKSKSPKDKTEYYLDENIKYDKVMFARQNLKKLISEYEINKEAKYWGIVKKNEDPVYNWRSGIGLTKDKKYLIYGAGNAISAVTLGKALKLAGAYDALHLDMNISNIAFNFYKITDGNIVPYSLSERLWPEMIGKYIKGYSHDFFYLTLKMTIFLNKNLIVTV